MKKYASGSQKSKLTQKQRSDVEDLEYVIRGHQSIIKALITDTLNPERAHYEIDRDKASIETLLARIQAAEDRLVNAPELIVFHQERIQAARARLASSLHQKKIDALMAAAAALYAVTNPVEQEDEDEDDEDDSPALDDDAVVEEMWAAAEQLEHADDDAKALSYGHLPQGE